MPTQLPREATDFFGDLLLPHVKDILKSDAEKVKKGINEALPKIQFIFEKYLTAINLAKKTRRQLGD